MRSTATAPTWRPCGCCRPPGWSARSRPSGVIERFAGRLAERGALYDLEADQYFARGSDDAFGSVSGLDRGEMLALFAERGGDPGRPGKKDPLDALVWLGARPHEPAWASRFGQGRPGWHVECAAISTEYLGTTFDVQAGGTDLIFPHHEMSASHARVALEPDAFARHYVHAGMVRLDGEKMSKSLGNLVFVSRLLADGHDPMAVRLAILAHHYRRDWDWTDAGLSAATDRLARWREAVQVAGAACVRAQGPASGGPASSGPASGGPRPPAVRWPRAAAWRAARRPQAAARPCWLRCGSGSPMTSTPRGRWRSWTAGPRTCSRAQSPPADSGADLVRDAVDALLGVAL